MTIPTDAKGAPCRRRNAFREDLADARLRGIVDAPSYVEGRAVRCNWPSAPLRSRPDQAAAFTAELIMGEPAMLFEERAGWAWVRSERDGYVGYAPAEALGEPGAAPTHRVSVARAHLYPVADFKSPPLGRAPLGGQLSLSGRREGRFVEAEGGGWLVADHLTPLSEPETDWVSVAERLHGAPYLWGGETVEGVDCSGLVQIALEQTGRACPRDSDMQERELGRPLGADEPLRRGDLVFWKGHVGLMLDAETLLHANAGAMLCAREDLAAAIARIENAGDGSPTARRRID